MTTGRGDGVARIAVVDDVVDRSVRLALDLSPAFVLVRDFSLHEDLGVDSFQLMAIVVNIEIELGVEFEPDALTSLETIGDLIRVANAMALP